MIDCKRALLIPILGLAACGSSGDSRGTPTMITSFLDVPWGAPADSVVRRHGPGEDLAPQGSRVRLLGYDTTLLGRPASYRFEVDQSGFYVGRITVDYFTAPNCNAVFEEYVSWVQARYPSLRPSTGSILPWTRKASCDQTGSHPVRRLVWRDPDAGATVTAILQPSSRVQGEHKVEIMWQSPRQAENR